MAQLVKDKSQLNEEALPALTEIIGEEEKATAVVEAAKASMGEWIITDDSSQQIHERHHMGGWKARFIPYPVHTSCECIAVIHYGIVS